MMWSLMIRASTKSLLSRWRFWGRPSRRKRDSGRASRRPSGHRHLHFCGSDLSRHRRSPRAARRLDHHPLFATRTGRPQPLRRCRARMHLESPSVEAGHAPAAADAGIRHVRDAVRHVPLGGALGRDGAGVVPDALAGLVCLQAIPVARAAGCLPKHTDASAKAWLYRKLVA